MQENKKKCSTEIHGGGGGDKLEKLVHVSGFSHPNLWTSWESALGILSVRRSFLAFVRSKQTVV